jgi:hypothetical protein
MLRTRTWNRLLGTGLCVVALCAAGSVSAKPKTKVAPPTAAAPSTNAVPDAPATAPAAASGADAKAGEANSAAESAPEAPAAQDSIVASAPAAQPAPARAQLSAEQLQSLRAETSQLIDEMAQARAKAALLGKTLFKTQLRLRFQNLAAPDPRLLKVVLKLDGAPVFVGDAAALSGDDARQVFEGFIAPGRHVLTAELKQQSQQDATFGYSLHDSYHFKAQRDKLSELTLIVDDDSDMASEYPDDGDGEYDVRLKLRVRTKNIGEE